jgi:hypothetical protein
MFDLQFWSSIIFLKILKVVSDVNDSLDFIKNRLNLLSISVVNPFFDGMLL